jgi:hypothetical protein
MCSTGATSFGIDSDPLIAKFYVFNLGPTAMPIRFPKYLSSRIRFTVRSSPSKSAFSNKLGRRICPIQSNFGGCRLHIIFHTAYEQYTPESATASPAKLPEMVF